jgi:putative transposase
MYDPDKHHRRSILLRDYDYSRAGAYFVTICAFERKCIFGEINNGEMRLNDLGTLAEDCWLAIPEHFPMTQMDAYVIMPNHMHGIVVIDDDADHCKGTACRAPTMEQFGQPTPGSLPTIVRSFKSAVTRLFNEKDTLASQRLWQRNYYEHIIRDDESLNRIREYIATNPLHWEFDAENPNRTGS